MKITELQKTDAREQLARVPLAAKILAKAANAFADGDEDTALRHLMLVQEILDPFEPIAEWSTDNVLVEFGAAGYVTITDDGGTYVCGSIDAAIAYCRELLNSLSSASPEWWGDDYTAVLAYLEGNR